MVDKMQSNAAFMANHIRRTWAQIFRELSGGGDKGGASGGGSSSRGW